ncbi:transglutaminase-like domain-containing protein [Niallia taxi]|uniref:transglutaminase-like domain-containing protein n=1 Tax=Niallia taxi TaxID=2499688 RepID=UPI0015F438B9|nr:transglutaminase-like domain-containing protein [Niallia taxi]
MSKQKLGLALSSLVLLLGLTGCLNDDKEAAASKEKTAKQEESAEQEKTQKEETIPTSESDVEVVEESTEEATSPETEEKSSVEESKTEVATLPTITLPDSVTSPNKDRVVTNPKPVTQKPAPVKEQPKDQAPAPAPQKPVEQKPVEQKPVTQEPVKEQPTPQTPVVETPVVEEPVTQEPVTENPVVQEPVTEEPVTEEPVIEEPVVEEPVTQEPVEETPVVEEPVAETPVEETPVVEEPVTETPVVEEPVVETPVEDTLTPETINGITLSTTTTNKSMTTISGSLVNENIWIRVESATNSALYRDYDLWNVNGSFSKTLFFPNGAGQYTVKVFEKDPNSDYYRQVAVFTVTNTDTTPNMAYLTPSDQIQSDNAEIISLAKAITMGLTTDLEKSKAIYDWVTTNIAYDYDAFTGVAPYGDQTALGALSDAEVVCQGYSALTAALHRAIGIPAMLVFGEGDGDGVLSNPDHAWNKVLIDGQWIIMDTTWGAGYINSEEKFVFSYTDFFFNTDPTEFNESHTEHGVANY